MRVLAGGTAWPPGVGARGPWVALREFRLRCRPTHLEPIISAHVQAARCVPDAPSGLYARSNHCARPAAPWPSGVVVLFSTDAPLPRRCPPPGGRPLHVPGAGAPAGGGTVGVVINALHHHHHHRRLPGATAHGGGPHPVAPRRLHPLRVRRGAHTCGVKARGTRTRGMGARHVTCTDTQTKCACRFTGVCQSFSAKYLWPVSLCLGADLVGVMAGHGQRQELRARGMGRGGAHAAAPPHSMAVLRCGSLQTRKSSHISTSCNSHVQWQKGWPLPP